MPKSLYDIYDARKRAGKNLAAPYEAAQDNLVTNDRGRTPSMHKKENWPDTYVDQKQLDALGPPEKPVPFVMMENPTPQELEGALKDAQQTYGKGSAVENAIASRYLTDVPEGELPQNPQGTDPGRTPQLVAGVGAGTPAPLDLSVPVASQSAMSLYDRYDVAKGENNQYVRDFIKNTLLRAIPGEDKVLAVADQLGVSPDVARQKMPEFERALQASKYNIDEFVRSNPELTKMIMERPDVFQANPEVFLAKSKLPAYERIWKNAWHEFAQWEKATFFGTEEQKKAFDEREKMYGSIRDTILEFVAGVLPEKAAKAVRSYEGSIRAADVVATLDKPPDLSDTVSLKRKAPAGLSNFDAARYNFQTGLNTMEYHRAEGKGVFERILTGELSKSTANNIFNWKQAAVPYDISTDGLLSSIAVDASGSAGGLIGNLIFAGKTSAGVGMGVGALTFAATKNPYMAYRAAAAANGMVFSPAMAWDLFQTGVGGTYSALKDMKLDDGSYIGQEEALALSVISGAINTALFMNYMPGALKALGPLGEIMQGKTTVQQLNALNPLLKDVGFRSMLKQVVHNLRTSGQHLTALGVTSSVVESVAEWAAKSATAGAPQAIHPVEVSQKALSTIPGSAYTTLFLGLPGTVSTAWLGLANKAAQGERVLQTMMTVGALKGVRTEPGDTLSPKLAGEVLRRQGIKSFWIETDIIRQEGGEQTDALVTKLLGPEGPDRLRKAEASGERLEVPVEQYVQTFFQETEGGMAAEKFSKDTSVAPKNSPEGGLTFREIVERAKADKDSAQALKQGWKDYLKAQKIEVDPIERWLDQKVKELMSLGKFSEEDAGDFRKMTEEALYSNAAGMHWTPYDLSLNLEIEFGNVDNTGKDVPSPKGKVDLQAEIQEKAAIEAERKLARAKADLKRAEEEAAKSQKAIETPPAPAPKKGKKTPAPKSDKKLAALQKKVEEAQKAHDEFIAGEKSALESGKKRTDEELDAAADQKDALVEQLAKAQEALNNYDAPAPSAPVEEPVEPITVVKLTKKEIAAEKKRIAAEKKKLIAAEEAKAKAKEEVQISELEKRRADMARAAKDPKVDQELRHLRGLEKEISEKQNEVNRIEKGIAKSKEKDPEANTRLERAKIELQKLKSEEAHTQLRIARLTGSGSVFNQVGDKVTRGFVRIIRQAEQTLYKVFFTPDANYSTLMHEAGHIYLDMLGKLDVHRDATPEIKARAEAARRWLGATDLTNLTEAQGEKFARHFEKYLYEGKAPSAALAGVFQRARLQLIDVYRGTNEMEKYKIDPQVRAIMDSMLATDTEIKRYNAAREIPPAFRTALEAGMDGPTWEAYLKTRAEALSAGAQAAERAALAKARRVTEVWWRDHFNALKSEFAERLKQTGAYRAWRFLTLGETAVQPHDVDVLYPVGYRVTFERKGKTYTGEVVEHKLHETSEDVADNKIVVKMQGGKKMHVVATEITTKPKRNVGEVIVNEDWVNKLDIAAAKKALTKEVFDKYNKAGFFVKDGLDPEDVAKSHGFNNAIELFGAIDAMPNIERYAEENAHAEMQRRYPEVQADRAQLEELVGYAMKNRGTAEAALKELQAMYSRSQQGLGGMPAMRAFRLAAIEILRTTAVEDLKPARLLATEARLSREALTEMAKGNFNLAVVKKQQAILNGFLFREVLKAKDQKGVVERLVKEATRTKFREGVAEGHRAFLDAIDIVLEAIGAYEEKNPVWLAERNSLESVLQVLEGQLVPPAFDTDVIRTIVTNRIKFEDLNYGQMMEVKKWIRQFEQEGRDFATVVDEGQRKAKVELIQRINQDNLGKPRAAVEPRDKGTKSDWWHVGSRLRGMADSLTEPFYFIRKLGPTAEKFFIWRYEDARSTQDRLTKVVVDAIDANWRNMPKFMSDRRFVNVPDAVNLPNRAGMHTDLYGTRQWMWMIWLHMGSKTGRDRLLKGYGWREKDVIDFLNKNMTPEEAQFLQSVHDLLDQKLWPEISMTYAQAHGIPPKRTDALEMKLIKTDANGNDVTHTFRGGYIPVRYKEAWSQRSLTPDEVIPRNVYENNAAAASVYASFTNPRDAVATSTEVPILDWSLLPGHIGSVIHYVAFDAFIRDSAKVLGDANMKNLVIERLGESGRSQIMSWMKDLAHDNTTPLIEASKDGWWVINKFRTAFVNSVIMYNIPVFLGDVFPGPLVAIANREVQAKYILPEMARFVPSMLKGVSKGFKTPDYIKDVRDQSVVVSHRADKSLEMLANFMYDTTRYGKRGIGEPGTALYSVTSVGGNIRHTIQHYGWVLMDTGDKAVSSVIWGAGYRQAMARFEAKGMDISAPETIDLARREADARVSRCLPVRDRSEMPSFLRDKKAMANLVVFFSYASKVWQMQRELWAPTYEAWAKEMQDVGARTGKQRLVSALIKATPEFVVAGSYMLAFMSLTGPVAEWVSGRGREDDESVGQWYMRKLIAHPFQMHPLTGWAGDLFGSMAVGKKTPPLMSMRSAPAAAGVQRVFSGVSRAFGDNGTADPHAPIWAGLDALLTAMSLPASQPIRTLRFVDGAFIDNAYGGDPIYGPMRRSTNPIEGMRGLK